MDQISIENLIKNSIVFIPLFIWVTVWRGIALWKAARNSHKKWFVALLILNTFGILEMVYVFVFSKKIKEKL